MGLRSFTASDSYCSAERVPRAQEPATLQGHETENKVVVIQRLREEAGDLTLRAEEVDTQTACINIDHVDEHFGGPLLMDADCQAIFEVVEGSECEAAEAKQPSEKPFGR